jgi:zinc protease
VRDQVLDTVKRFQSELVAGGKLEAVKSRERYQFTMQLDNSQTVAATVARYVAMKRTPDTIDRLFALYAQLTPEDIRAAARKYLVESGRTIVTLTSAAGRWQVMRSLPGLCWLPAPSRKWRRLRLEKSRWSRSNDARPAQRDPTTSRPRTSHGGDARGRRHQDRPTASRCVFPMASLQQGGSEMTTFTGPHFGNLDTYYKLFRAMLPGCARRLSPDEERAGQVSRSNERNLQRSALLLSIVDARPLQYGHGFGARR